MNLYVCVWERERERERESERKRERERENGKNVWGGDISAVVWEKKEGGVLGRGMQKDKSPG